MTCPNCDEEMIILDDMNSNPENHDREDYVCPACGYRDLI